MPTKTLIEVDFKPEEANSFKLHQGKGCGLCNGTGYKEQAARTLRILFIIDTSPTTVL